MSPSPAFSRHSVFRRALSVVIMLVCALALAGHGQATEASRPQSAEAFIALDPLNISIIQNLRIRGLLQVEVGLDVPDSDLRSRTLALYPRLQDAYVQVLQFYAANRLDVRRVPDVNEIARVLQAVTDKVLQQKGAHLLLSQVMLQRPY